ncbi:RDD family protein [Poseidonibacter lekithochrous]|uniref:RDD family protein n=1 Tax=Poseidonibacter TaxID=2321187 RepID=UPI001C09B9B4|nr:MULTISPECIES: RDD family protein [Poseidonibacter]MBU3014813.1 RDD family protein [Poseidonibacter lekithochrous]MDO6828111.1 RDD family protein [Poseidonibacter sp. 1_MG-2023]
MSNNTNDLQLASLRSRATAFVIDDLLVTAIILIIFWENIMAVSHDVNAMMFFMKTDLVMPLIFLKFVYQALFTWYYGATVGKIVTKIKVIDANNWGRVSIFSAILRSIGRIFSEMFFYVGFLIGFFNDGRKTFHDFTGKTLVVNA